MSIPGRHSQIDGGRIVKNTILLYFRMLLLMLVGLFTTRVVLKSLGVVDYGIYNAVGGVVTIFSALTASLASSVSRFITVELGKEDSGRLHRVFSTSVLIQLAMGLLLVLLAETAGAWYVHNHLVLPDGRIGDAMWVLHFSAALFLVNMLSVPFNATIIAHERMSAFAVISIFEAVLKLGVALALFLSPSAPLRLYAVLMFAVGLAVRLTYGLYCSKSFEETRGPLLPDPALCREMASFAGWSFLGSGAFVLNTQGLTLLINRFFGVILNSARGIASQVEAIVKQFATNVITAINPQITKSWAAGEYEASRLLVCRCSKFIFLVVLAFVVPLLFEADLLLGVWLEEVPERASVFVRLTLVGMLVEYVCNPFTTLILAEGDIRRYYVSTSAVALLVLPLTWLSFRSGMPDYSAYLVYIAVYIVVDVLRIAVVARKTGLKISMFVRETLLRVLPVAFLTFAATLPFGLLMQDGWLRLIVVVVASTMSLALSSYYLALSAEERSAVRSHLPFV